MKKQLYTLAALLMMGLGANAQVGIGTVTPHDSSMLDIVSTSKGFLMPRMLTAERTAIASPAAGLQVYDTETKSIWYFDGTAWVNGGGQNIYNTNGTLTSPRTVTMGTNTLGFVGNNVGIGTATPSNKLEINSGTPTISGLKFTQLNSYSGVSAVNVATLGVDANGNVVTVTDNVGSGTGIGGNGAGCPGLGYSPIGTAAAAPTTITIGGTVFTKSGTLTAPASAGGHSYVNYWTAGGTTVMSWYRAYTAAKNMGGYLPVVTTAAETEYLATNNTVAFAANSSSPSSTSPFFCGMIQNQSYPTTEGNNSKMPGVWINCETSTYNYATADYDNNGAFLPMLSTAPFACLALGRVSATTMRLNQVNVSPTATGGPIGHLLVEFNQ